MLSNPNSEITLKSSDILNQAYLDLQKRENGKHIKVKIQPKRSNKFLIAAVLILVILICIGLARATEIDLSIIAKIESSNNPYAYNHTIGATGLYQITKICYQDYLNHFGKRGTSGFVSRCMSDLYDVKLNKKVAVWYLTRRIPQMLRAKGKPVTVENILIAYNAGIGRVVKGIKPSETRQYLKKYQKLAKGGARDGGYKTNSKTSLIGSSCAQIRKDIFIIYF